MRVMKKLGFLLYIVIPALSVHLSLVFETAQGEDVEEIVSGIIIGLAIDLLFYAIYRIVKRITA